MSNVLPALEEDLLAEAALSQTGSIQSDDTEQVQRRPLPSRHHLGEHPLWPDYLAAVAANRRADQEQAERELPA